MQITSNQYKAILNKNKPNKYNAKKTIVDGIKFPSKKEAEYYSFLKTSKENGIVKLFLRQTPFHLPGNVKYLLDFLVFYNDGRILFIDVKGKDTPISNLKRKQVTDLYGIEINLV